MSNVNCLLVLWLMVLITQSSTVRSHDDRNFSDAALYIIQEHISIMTTTIVIAEHCTLPELANTNAQLLDYILQNLHERISVQFYIRGNSHSPFEYYVFIADTVGAFRSLFSSFVDTRFERNYRFLIILTRLEVEHLKEFFWLCSSIDVIDVTILSDDPYAGASVYVYYMFSKYNMCRGYLPVLMYSFRLSPGSLPSVFPNKLRNLQGCPFKVSARSYSPFFTFIGNKSKPEPVNDWDNISGIEGSLLKFLATTMNFKIDLQPFPKERSYVKGNQSHGCLKQVKDRKVDIAVGGFVDSNDGRWVFSPTGQYHNCAFRYVVRGKHIVSSLGRLAKPFTKQVWILVIGFLVLSIIFISVLKMVSLKVHQFVFGEANQNSVLNFLAVFLGYSVTRTPSRHFARYIFLLMLLFTLILRNAYQGSLYDAFRMDSFAQTPSGLDDLYKWNYTMLLPPESSELLTFPIERTIQVKNDGYEPRLKMLEKLEGKYATVAIQDGFTYYVQKKLRNGNELLLIPEVICNYQFVMYLPKHSIYLSVFDKKLKEFAAAGILERLRYRFTKNDQFISIHLMQKQKKVPLNNKRLYALYVICGILIAISAAVFCLEIFSVRYTRLQRMFI